VKEVIEATIYKCGYCGDAYYDKNKAIACHSDRLCSVCGEPIGKRDYYLSCEKCRETKAKELEEKVFEKAEKLTLEEYCDRFPDNFCWYDEDYFTVDDIEIKFEDYDEIPKYIWGTEKLEIALDPYSIIEDFEESTELDYFDLDKEAVEDIVDFCKTWNAKHYQIVYTQSNKVVILLED